MNNVLLDVRPGSYTGPRNGAVVVEDQDKSRPAGGYATQRGINYQNRVAAYFAACCLAERVAFRELSMSPIKSIRCETGEPLADILISCEDDSIVFVEVKRSFELGAARMKPLLSHLIEQYLVSTQGTSGGKFPWRRPLDAARDRLFLVTSSDSPAKLTQHLSACLSRIHPESRPEDLRAIPQNAAERDVFEDFHSLLQEAWTALIGSEPAAEQVVRLLSLFRIGVLDASSGESAEQDAQAFLMQTVLAGTSDGQHCWATLTQIMARASESRMFVTREELRRELQRANFTLASTPSYREDINALRRYTQLTLESLNHLATLVVHGRDIRIERPVTKYLREEAEMQSLVVIGDPGAGKSGVLHELATALDHEKRDIVFLAADRLDESLKLELSLKYDMGEVLENWSGERPGLLFIDALDAARGSGALQVLRDLISRVATTPGSRWRVIASIRVFDLRYSQELQRIFRRGLGEPGPDQYQDNSFFVRHIKVPRFSPDELKDIRTKAPELDAIFNAATPALYDLLNIPFNLRLVAEMLSESGERADFRGIETQVGLLEKYWLSRVIKSVAEGNVREAVLTELVSALVRARKLTIAKSQILNTTKDVQFSFLCSDNVIVEQVANLHGRNIIGFSHHLLFDYAVSRLVLASDFEFFLGAIASERDLSLFLRPSIDLFFKEAWLRSREEFWSYLTRFSSHEGVPAIAKIIGPSVIPELAKTESDLTPLVRPLGSADSRTKEICEQWIVHVVGAVLAGLPTSSLEIWSRFCLELTQITASVRIAGVCQTLIDHLLERGQSGSANTRAGRLALSRAAVSVLNRFASGQRREGWVVGRSISNVMDLFKVNPEESAAALRKLITPEEIQLHGAEQGHWIARKVPQLFDVAPQLAADIFTAFFGYTERSEEQTSMGGGRILAMTSNRRQDYHHAHWQLAQFFHQFVEEHFQLCKPIIMAAVGSLIESEHAPRTRTDGITYTVDGETRTVLVDYSAIWDSSSVRSEALDIADAYFEKLEALLKLPSTAEVAREIAAEFLRDAQYAYFLRKILTVAKNTGPSLAKIVYPLFTSDAALWSYDLSSLIGEALQTNYIGLDEPSRKEVELAIHQLCHGEEGDRLEAKEDTRDKLLGCIPVDQLVLPESIKRVKEMSSKGGPPVNRPPYISHGVRVSPYSEAERMRERGVPIDAEPNATLREKGKRLWEFATRFNNGIPKESDLSGIEPEINSLQTMLVDMPEGLHKDVLNSVEAQLLAACATAAKVKSLDCDGPLGQKLRTILFSGLASTEPKYNPKDDAQWDRTSGWGAPVQRIEAAAGIGNLIAHRSCVDEVLLTHVRRAIADPVPAVRFQVATRLLPLYDKDLNSLWSILSTFVREEPRAGVLSGALYGVIQPLAGRYRAEVVELIRALLGRTDLANNGGEAFEWGHRIATGLYIWQDDAAAFALVRPRLEGESFRPGFAGQCIRDMREALAFSSDVPKETDKAIRQRAFGVIEIIVTSITNRMDHLIHGIKVEDRDGRWQEDFQELARLVDYIGNQIYFSSGAYDGKSSQKQMSTESRRIFWKESQHAIRLLSDVAIPSAAHHLVKTLQSFISFEPIGVFHAIAAVVKSAKSWGYQYESMAVDLLVKVTESYIAEYRMELQKDRQSREELIDILETFVEAGWPSARRLSYRLEEIFR